MGHVNTRGFIGDISKLYINPVGLSVEISVKFYDGSSRLAAA
jgi:hypothetical protein